MNDNKLKEMWKSTENLAGAPGYETEAIERFLNSRSSSVATKIARMLLFDIALKLIIALAFIGIALNFYGAQPEVFYTCIASMVLILPLVWFESTVLRNFNSVANNNRSTKDKLSGMLVFLQSRFFSAVLSVSLTYLFFFIAGSLLYFYRVYGQVRPLDNMDVFVFSTFCLFGMGLNFWVNTWQVNYYKKHLKTCLKDLNNNVLEMISSNIETQLKHDLVIKLLLGLIVVLGFIIFVAVLKKYGF